MQHDIPLTAFGPSGQAMGRAVDKCVHCGLCLAACPTYRVLGEEMDSPRGRIFLMKEALEGALTKEEVLPYVDRCLGCMACTTACPSGVEYGDLLSPFRSIAEERRKRPAMDAAARRLIRETLPFPKRFRMAYRLAKLTSSMKGLAPAAFSPLMDLLPEQLPSANPLPALIPAQGKRRARVALLAGCVQQVLSPEINWATARVLSRNGVEVVVPGGQGCCGSLPMHIGEWAQARDLARRNLLTFPDDVDAVITNAAGCGSGIHEYPLLFSEHEDSADAARFAKLTLDISVFLDRLGIESPPAAIAPVKLAYHDACHLAHAQGVILEPRRLLSMVSNVELLEIPENDMCCGSAGTYNLEQPELARQLGERKVKNALSVHPDLIATGNIGCTIQIQNHANALGEPLPVVHTMVVLDRAYAGVSLVTGQNEDDYPGEE
jgi:glycolate oxidase iron-sulfur subunit